MNIALAHDYVTQRGGAERVALAMIRAFPGAPLHTTLYDPAGTFPEFADADIRTMPIDRWGVLRRNHRLALPFLARAVSGYHVGADVLLASSSGWAHGIPTSGRKVVYCHAPARWLYQSDRYAGREDAGARGRAVRAAIGVLGPGLREWDQAAAHSADRYLVNSTVVQAAVREAYGIESEVLAPPPAPVAAGDAEPVSGVGRPFVLCVARLLPYKNVDHVIEAVAALGGTELVVVGDGPERARLAELAARTGTTHLVGRVSDAQLHWLYQNCEGLVAASYEDFGLSPLEAGSFGKPTAALRDGGYLDTVVERTNGVFFDGPDAEAIAAAVHDMLRISWSASAIRDHAGGFSEERFAARLRAVVAEEAARV
ncbi:glycosyltransferase [Microbacterium kyungheense]|uniref:D-inositol 3-phosphate glycosyltransferase n=1 Tax=Microbacterium kyungheense TaxID=1263636 RepID=A0A543ERX1_9MICO|nr:glycosyltransferase [Microbacterium kyungheense]TQM24315.1 glycosyltransferase involved in cell wall biosynthesis [Microbacterium kyungheense]